MSYLRPNIAAMRGYVPGEQPQGGGFIKLNTNENPYPPSPRVLDALRATCTEIVRLYPDPMSEALRRKAAEVYGFRPENVLAGNGADDLLTLIVRTFVDAGEAVVMPVPTYSLYTTLAEIQGGRALEIPFPDNYSLPAGLAEAAAKVLFIANPNSPSGTTAPGAQIADLADRFDGMVVVDETYVDFADHDCMALARARRNVIVLRTFSKAFSLCGLRVGLAFADAEIIDNLAKVKDSYNVNRLAAVAAVAALEDIDFMRANAAKIKATRARLTQALTSMGFHVWPSQANFVLARAPAGKGRPTAGGIYERLKERRILVRFWDTPRLRDSLRISIGSDAEIDALLANLRELWPGASGLDR